MIKTINEIRGTLAREIEMDQLSKCVKNKSLVYADNKGNDRIKVIPMNDMVAFIADSKIPSIGKNILLNSKSILEFNGVDEMVMLEYIGTNNFSSSYGNVSLLLDDQCENRVQLLEMIIEYVKYHLNRENGQGYWLFEPLTDLPYCNGYYKDRVLDYLTSIRDKEEEYIDRVIQEITVNLIYDVMLGYIYYTINNRDLGFKEKHFMF